MSTATARRILTAVAIGMIVGCEAPSSLAPSDSTELAALRKPHSLLPKLDESLVTCPTSETATTSTVVTPLGGVLNVAGTSLSIPAGALLQPVTVTLTVPASNYVEIELTVDGAPHFLFELPVTVTVSYARCNRSNIDHGPLSAWYIDSETKALLEQMPSIDNKLLRTVTFTTGHFSGYALAN